MRRGEPGEEGNARDAMRALRALPALLAVLCAGCIKLSLDLTIQENGSGTLALAYSIAEQTAGQFTAMRKLEKEMKEAAGLEIPATAPRDYSRLLFSPVKEDIVKLLKECEKYGIATDRLEQKSRDVRREVDIRVRIEDIGKASRSDVFQQYGFSLRKDAKGNYVLHRGSALAPGQRVEALEPETAKLLTSLVGGLNVTITVSTPSRILSTTAQNSGPRSAMWIFDYDRNPKALTDLHKQNFTVVFEGGDMKLPEIILAAQTNAPAPAARR
jgi:hypothetical protein